MRVTGILWAALALAIAAWPGIAATAEQDLSVNARLLLAARNADAAGLDHALKAGAAGYLTKQSAPALLVTAIRHVAAGKKYVSPALAEELASSLGADTEQPPHETLSDREFQTLRLIASGKSLSGIAAELRLSPKTISVYRARLLEKLKLSNNSALTRYAIKNQLVD